MTSTRHPNTPSHEVHHPSKTDRDTADVLLVSRRLLRGHTVTTLQVEEKRNVHPRRDNTRMVHRNLRKQTGQDAALSSGRTASND